MPRTQANQQLDGSCPPQEASAKGKAAALQSVAHTSKGSDQPQANSQKPSPEVAANNVTITVAATTAVATDAQQPAPTVTFPAATVPSHAAPQALAASIHAAEGLHVATTSAAGPSRATGGPMAARSEGRAFLTLQVGSLVICKMMHPRLAILNHHLPVACQMIAACTGI